MNFSDFENLTSRGSVAQSLKPRYSGARTGGDGPSGAALLRRAGKAVSVETTLRGAAGATLLAARLRSAPEDRLSRQLREHYQDLLREPVPERFLELIAALEAGRDP